MNWDQIAGNWLCPSCPPCLRIREEGVYESGGYSMFTTKTPAGRDDRYQCQAGPACYPESSMNSRDQWLCCPLTMPGSRHWCCGSMP
jgi:hypothetical protein